MVIPVLQPGVRQGDFEFKASLGYVVDLRPGELDYRYPAWKTKQDRKQQQLYSHTTVWLRMIYYPVDGHFTCFYYIYFFIITNFQGWGWHPGPSACQEMDHRVVPQALQKTKRHFCASVPGLLRCLKNVHSCARRQRLGPDVLTGNFPDFATLRNNEIRRRESKRGSERDSRLCRSRTQEAAGAA